MSSDAAISSSPSLAAVSNQARAAPKRRSRVARRERRSPLSGMRQAAGGHEAFLHIGEPDTFGTQDTGHERDQDLSDSKLARDVNGVQTTCPAKRHEREGAGGG